MSEPRPLPPDQPQRLRALGTSRSVLVEAPAGSGKTDLLTRRFLALLAEVADPSEILAITFTRAAAAEMRNRILAELERAASEPVSDPDPASMATLAARALGQSERLGWRLLDLPSQLRISTIDAFSTEIALQLPLLSGIGVVPRVEERPQPLYRRAARETLRQIDTGPAELRQAIEQLLRWRDNNWQDVENQLVEMLEKRDLWMQPAVFDAAPDWDRLRARLERPFQHALHSGLDRLHAQLLHLPGLAAEAARLAAFALTSISDPLLEPLALSGALPAPPYATAQSLVQAHAAALGLAQLVLTKEGQLRATVNKNHGFPTTAKPEKQRLLALIDALRSADGLDATLAQLRHLPAPVYSPEEWRIVRSAFVLLHRAAAHLRVVFAESGAVDFAELGQTALRVLAGEDNLPSDAAFALAGRIRHLLVDEFQDTSRAQHQLLSRIVSAWPEQDGRTCFVVGDPKQSIYFFRSADTELFLRARSHGLSVESSALPALPLDPVDLSANFRTAHSLVETLNHHFNKIFEIPDGSGIDFAPAQPSRPQPGGETPFGLHLVFLPASADPPGRARILDAQTEAIVDRIAVHLPAIEAARQARARDGQTRFRVAVLARAKKHLAPIARSLRRRHIPFRAVDTESLAGRPEILDAVALARALLDPQDRIAWLGLLRAPWCALSLDDLFLLAAGGAPASCPIPGLLAERLPRLSPDGRAGLQRVLAALDAASASRAAAPGQALGTWLAQTWTALGGPFCTTPAERQNLAVLWSLFDALPRGEQDLFSGVLAQALETLNAEPDPAASEACGVQLMTIHKSKGLEFEVVLLPDLQAAAQRSRGSMLSWLERGLLDQDPDGLLTEFLVAPIPQRGLQAGSTRQWVQQALHLRERQEMRRLLYVAATRARDQLHLFAQLPCRQDKSGQWQLAPLKESLLQTAWPALEPQVQSQFAAWVESSSQAAAPPFAGLQLLPSAPAPSRQDPASAAPEPADLFSLVAQADGNLLVLPAATRLRRLPPELVLPAALPAAAPQAVAASLSALYQRHEGGLASRVLGRAVHLLLEHLARLGALQPLPQACDALASLAPRAAALARAAGLDPAEAEALAHHALQLALDVARDPIGAWILAPHASAQSEPAWSGLLDGRLRTLRPDRVFLAVNPPAPSLTSASGEIQPAFMSGENRSALAQKNDPPAFALHPKKSALAHDGNEDRNQEAGSLAGQGSLTWWIIDWKTAEVAPGSGPQSLSGLRALFAPQLEAYAELLRRLQSPSASSATPDAVAAAAAAPSAPIRAGLYYPRLRLFDSWPIDEAAACPQINRR